MARLILTPAYQHLYMLINHVILPIYPQAKSLPGSIRGDYCIAIGRNILHGSDSVETANREIALWFKDSKDLCEWKPASYGYVYE